MPIYIYSLSAIPNPYRRRRIYYWYILLVYIISMYPFAALRKGPPICCQTPSPLVTSGAGGAYLLPTPPLWQQIWSS